MKGIIQLKLCNFLFVVDDYPLNDVGSFLFFLLFFSCLDIFISSGFIWFLNRRQLNWWVFFFFFIYLFILFQFNVVLFDLNLNRLGIYIWYPTKYPNLFPLIEYSNIFSPVFPLVSPIIIIRLLRFQQSPTSAVAPPLI